MLATSFLAEDSSKCVILRRMRLFDSKNIDIALFCYSIERLKEYQSVTVSQIFPTHNTFIHNKISLSPKPPLRMENLISHQQSDCPYTTN